ncbi:MAG: MBL fold metallo-hydrolase, partial [Polyangiales bacterium]
MPNTVLYDQNGHKNILLPDFGHGGLAVQANQHLVIHGNEGMILDPGGHKVYNKVLSETTSLLGGAQLKYLFLSHQDPDIIAAVNGWLMTTDAEAYISSLWIRFVPHFGLDRLVADRLKPIPDEG